MIISSVPDALHRLFGWTSTATSKMSSYTSHATHHLFVPSPAARPLPIWAAAVPPLTYYLALFLLPPLSSKSFSLPIRRAASAVRTLLAAVSLYTFASLPFKYYYPAAPVLTYQLGLVGWYGASRVLDIFFLSTHASHDASSSPPAPRPPKANEPSRTPTHPPRTRSGRPNRCPERCSRSSGRGGRST